MSGKNMKKAAVPEMPGYRVIFAGAVMLAVMLTVFAVRLHIEMLTGRSLEVFANTKGMYADWFLYCKESIPNSV